MLLLRAKGTNACHFDEIWMLQCPLSKNATNKQMLQINTTTILTWLTEHTNIPSLIFLLKVLINFKEFYLLYFSPFSFAINLNLKFYSLHKTKRRFFLKENCILKKDKAALILEFWTMNCWIFFECTFHFHMTSNHCTKIDFKWHLFRYFTLICLFMSFIGYASSSTLHPRQSVSESVVVSN